MRKFEQLPEYGLVLASIDFKKGATMADVD